MLVCGLPAELDPRSQGHPLPFNPGGKARSVDAAAMNCRKSRCRILILVQCWLLSRGVKDLVNRYSVPVHT